MSDSLEVMFLRRQLLELRQQIAMRPVGVPMRTLTPWMPLVQIVGGQLINTIPVIQYAADPITAPSAYDPNVTTSTIAGIGIGYLYSPTNGQNLGKVLVRHRFAGMTDPLMGGDVYLVAAATVAISVSGGGTISAYDVIGCGA